jgi:hypothetical protein
MWGWVSHINNYKKIVNVFHFALFCTALPMSITNRGEYFFNETKKLPFTTSVEFFLEQPCCNLATQKYRFASA